MAEIERKFLVKELPDLEEMDYSDILQGYISISPEIRIRRDGEMFYITKKGDGLLVREEKEEEISATVFEILEPLVVGNLISKRRYRIPISTSLIAELDIYHSQLEGLTTVEVEFPTEEAASNFLKPSWFGEEITFDKRFKNKSLSQLDLITSLLSMESDVKSLVKKDV